VGCNLWRKASIWGKVEIKATIEGINVGQKTMALE
jgi:hypothetical protein